MNLRVGISTWDQFEIILKCYPCNSCILMFIYVKLQDLWIQKITSSKFSSGDVIFHLELTVNVEMAIHYTLFRIMIGATRVPYINMSITPTRGKNIYILKKKLYFLLLNTMNKWINIIKRINHQNFWVGNMLFWQSFDELWMN